MSIRIALAGNPNCGKTTLFNGLTGANQYTGNWPGVTAVSYTHLRNYHLQCIICGQFLSVTKMFQERRNAS